MRGLFPLRKERGQFVYKSTKRPRAQLHSPEQYMIPVKGGIICIAN